MKIRKLCLIGSLAALVATGVTPMSAQVSTQTKTQTALERASKTTVTSQKRELTRVINQLNRETTAVQKVARKADYQQIFNEDFSNATTFDAFTVINSNGDDKTWALATGEQKTCAKYDTHATNFGDDWLITPKITLPAGRICNVTFKAASRGPFYPEALEVKWGNAPTAEAMTNALMAKTEIKTERNKWNEYQYSIKANEAMDIYIGFHAVSNPNSFTLYVTDISVDNGSDLAAPDKVSNFEILPDLTGAAKATIQWKMPTKTIGGDEITDNMGANIYRGDELIKEFQNLSPGQEIAFNDELPALGTYTWSVSAFNTIGEGLTTSATKYIGEDIPARPENLKMVDNGNNSATMSWNPVTIGANGGFVDVNNLVYKIYNVIDGKLGEQIDEVNTPSVTTSDLDIDNGEARTEYLVVSAENNAGEGDVAIGMLIAGEPAKLPYKESFSSSTGTDNFIWTQTQGNSEMELTTERSSDGDGLTLGYITMNIGDNNWVNTEKISFADVKKPVLTFDIFPGDPSGFDGNITIKVEANIGQTGAADIELKSVNLNDLTAHEWNEVSVDLSQLVGEKYAIMKIHFIANDVFQFAYFDNLQIRDMVDHNLALTMTTPAEVIVQQPAHIEINLKNTGTKDVPAGQQVELYINDKLVNTLSTDQILANNSQTLTYDYAANITEGDKLNVRALLNYADDENENDNEATSQISILQNAVPTVTLNLTTEDGKATLSWDKPTLYQLGTNVTENFDDETKFEPFSTGGIDKYNEYGMLDEWFMWDADGIHTFTFANHDSYPNASGIMAWQVFKPSEVFDFEGADAAAKPIYEPHSGNQYMAAFGSEIQGGVEPSDNWLVSPQLDRSQQTIKFWTKLFNKNFTPETIEVRYTTEDVDFADYRLLTTIKQVDAEWTERTVTLPYGTLFFALRHTSEDKFVVVVDDISFRNSTPSGEGDAMTIAGYRIYRDGILIATVGAEDLSFTDEDLIEGDHTYNVTVVYSPDVESPMSEPVYTTAIDNIVIDGMSENICIFATDGRLIANGKNALKSLKAGVYIVKDNATGKTFTVVEK